MRIYLIGYMGSGKFIGANNKISYDSKSDEFIVFEFQAGTYEIKAVDDDFKL